MKHRWFWIIAAVAVLMGLAYVAFSTRGIPVDVVEMQPRPLLRTLRFSARVATLSRVDVGSTITGRVAQVLVDEGARVRQGQPLVRLESDGRSASRAALDQAEATLRAARAELERQQQLVAKGFVSASRVDDARRAVEVAQAQQASARAQVQAGAESGTDVAQAQAQLALAQAATQAARVRLAQADVLAPAAARVLSRQVEPGQIVQPGKPLLGLALEGPTQLVAPVDERFLDQLQVGQPAMVVADAFPGQPFPARVLSIAPAVDPQRGAVEVKLALQQQAPAFLREDMTLSVDVETGRRERALVVPLSALRAPGSDGAVSVLVVSDGRAQERRVRLGLRTLDAAEVTEGLSAGDRVLRRGIVPPGEKVRPTVVAWEPGQDRAAGGARDDMGSMLGNLGR